MHSLAGLFGRKSKSSSKQRGHETDSGLSSPATDYITPDRSLPSSPNGRSSTRDPAPSSVYPSIAQAASSSKLRLPFSRKKVSAAASTTSVVTTFSASQDSNFGTPPRPSYLNSRSSTSAASETEVDNRRLRPPPSKSAIFAAYGDPNLSTRSLPNEHASLTITTSCPDPPPPPPKKPGLFHWSKSSPSSPQTTFRKPKTSSPTQLSPTSPTSDPNSSFNLKSFRHVVPPASTASPNASNASLSPPIPRPRGLSINSDSSQRISVAAFREAQARRSTAGSPVPSVRAPSPGPLLSPSYAPRPHQHHTASAPAVPQHLQKRRSSGLAYASDSDETDSSEDDASDSNGSASPPRNGGGIMRRQRTVTKRADLDVPTIRGRGTKSEVGHGARRDFTPSPRVQSGYNNLTSQYPLPVTPTEAEESGRRSQSSLGFNLGMRPRASASASALTPSAAAKRASIVAAANAMPPMLGTGKRHSRSTSAHSISVAVTTSTPVHTHTRSRARVSPSSDSDSDDDAPLATLVPPRRPGSAMSSVSNRSLRSTATRSATTPLPAVKPLIDINELTQGRPRPRPGASLDGFTGGATLLSFSGTSTTTTTVVGAAANPVPTSVSPPTKFVSPPSSPPREARHLTKTSGSGQQQQQQLRSSGGAPMRREASPAVSGEERERDRLGERLTRVVQLKARAGFGSGSSSGSGSISTTSGSVLGVTTTTTTATATITPNTNTNTHAKPKLNPPPAPTFPTKLSPPEEDLAAVLGAGIHLVHRTGDSATDSEPESEESESDSDSEDGFTKVVAGKRKEPDRIAPIPIKQRAPPPAFSVTSRPNRSDDRGTGDRLSVASTNVLGQDQARQRQRSSTLIPSSSNTAFAMSSSMKPAMPNSSSSSAKESGKSTNTTTAAPAPRQRSSTLLPSSLSSSGMGNNGVNKNAGGAVAMPSRPFAAARRESPASSTGDSSSGRAPFTPKDGSDLGVGVRGGGAESVSGGWSGGVSGLTVKGRHMKRQSVSFEDDFRDPSRPQTKGKGGEAAGDREEKRRERRRSEAKAAIELGNVINGRGPVVVDDDDDDDLPINQTLSGSARMSTLNPMMAMGGGMPMGFGPGMPPGWNGMNMPMTPNMNMMGPNPGMLSPGQFMPQGGADPNFMAAHQQAMMFAKQAYQMAVAQQAMAAAGDEWERGSTIGGFGGGGGGGGSVYGGTSPSVVGGSQYGVNPMMMGMGMGMGMQGPGNGWSTGSVVFPGPARSMYGGLSGARSEYGGGGGGGGGQWNSSKSSYGESFGPSSNRYSRAGAGQGRSPRDSGYFPPVPPIPQQNASSSPGRGGSAAPRSRTTSQPASPSRGVRRAPPPSSWKAGV